MKSLKRHVMLEVPTDFFTTTGPTCQLVKTILESPPCVVTLNAFKRSTKVWKCGLELLMVERLKREHEGVVYVKGGFIKLSSRVFETGK